MPQKIYLVFSCDLWESKDSMRLEYTTTDRDKCKGFIAQKIKTGIYEYNYHEGATSEKQAEKFIEHFDSENNYFVKNALTYCTYMCVEDGEIL